MQRAIPALLAVAAAPAAAGQDWPSKLVLHVWRHSAACKQAFTCSHVTVLAPPVLAAMVPQEGVGVCIPALLVGHRCRCFGHLSGLGLQVEQPLHKALLLLHRRRLPPSPAHAGGGRSSVRYSINVIATVGEEERNDQLAMGSNILKMKNNACDYKHCSSFVYPIATHFSGRKLLSLERPLAARGSEAANRAWDTLLP